MQIAPRTLLCLTAWRVHVSIFGAPFDELRQLCEKADDKASLAMGMAGLVMEHANRAQLRDASALVAEYMAVIDSIGDPNLTVGLSFAAIQTKAETDELTDLIRWADTVIDLAEGDPTKGNIVIGSPLAIAMAARGFARWGQGDPQWRDDFDHALEIAREADALSHSIVIGYNYLSTIVAGVLQPTDEVLHDIDEALQIVQRTGDDFGLAMVKCSLGFALVNRDDATERQRGFEVLGDVRQMCVEGNYTLTELPVIDVFRAREWARAGDVDGALTVMRAAFDDVFRTGVVGWCNPTTRILVETLVSRGTDADLREAEMAVDRLEAGPRRHAGLAMRHTVVLRCRALLARARGDDARYADLLGRYRTAAADHRYQGHAAWAAAMPNVPVTNR